MKNKIYTIGKKETSVRFLEISELLNFDYSDILSVFDTNTRQLFPENLPTKELILPPGETSKNWESVEKILESSLNYGLARDSLFVGIGGGVICDMTAFAGSIYMRGAGIILIPTTLLAMADAALGGKTGIDFMGYKNMVGTFAPADEVRICIDLLSTLSDREYMNGLGEIFKHGLLRDRDILKILDSGFPAVLNRDKSVLSVLIQKSIAVKAWYVEQDAVENGIRAHLNLGHTFGHALESVSGFSNVSHGEAVVWGMVKALEAGLRLGVTSADWLEEVKGLADRYSYNLKTPSGIPAESLIDALQKDKKKRGSEIQFVLQREQGDTFLSPLDNDLLLETLSD